MSSSIPTLAVTGFVLGWSVAWPPGPINAEAIRRGLTGRMRAAYLVVLGGCAGDAIWALLVGLGRSVSRIALDPTLDWSILSWLRSVSSLPLLIKGILTADDARRAVDHGVDGIVVSNHGGRQLDGAVATLDALPVVAAAVAGTCPILIDGGIRRGTEVLKALALGADFVLIGRPFIYAAAIGGEAGVAHAIRLLADEISQDMALLGVSSLSELGPDRLAPA